MFAKSPMPWRGVVAAGLALLMVALSQPALAKTADQLRQVEQKLEAQKQEAQALEEKTKQTSASLNELRQKLIEAASRYQDKAEQQERLENKLDQLTDDIDVKSKALKTERHKLNLLTAALIELSRQPPITWFLQGGLTADHIHRAILLRAALPRLQSQAESFARDLDDLHQLQIDLAAQKHLLITAQQNLQGQQQDLDQLIKTRQGLLQRTEAQKESINKQLAALSSEAKDLRQLLERVTPKRQPKATGGLPSNLRPPVTGSLVKPYGAKDADGVVSQGLTYTALSGSPVVAPQTGKVVFAGPFRGYGKILILQHPGGYHSFLAGFGRIDADMGQEVGKGEPLGVLPVIKGTKPELYFEWRRNNEAVDPTSGIALSKGE